MTCTTSYSLPFTREQLRAKINRDADCAINALLKLVLHGGITIQDQSFLTSLSDQVIWRRRDHERGVNLEKPVLSVLQLRCLRKILVDCYLDRLYIIAEERAALQPQPVSKTVAPRPGTTTTRGKRKKSTKTGSS